MNEREITVEMTVEELEAVAATIAWADDQGMADYTGTKWAAAQLEAHERLLSDDGRCLLGCLKSVVQPVEADTAAYRQTVLGE